MITILRTLTFGFEVTARGFLGRLRQRGLAITSVDGAIRPTVALSAWTGQGINTSASLEIPVSDLRSLARHLLELADRHETSEAQPRRRATLTLERTAGLRTAG